MQLFRRIVQIAFVNNVVALEYAACLVPTDEHGDFLRDARANEIPDASASQIVEQPIDFGFLHSRCPRFPNIIGRRHSRARDRSANPTKRYDERTTQDRP